MQLLRKREILSVVKLFADMHEEIRKRIWAKEYQSAVKLLIECQQNAIDIGNIIESIEGEGTEAVKLLENYCEQVYQISIDIDSREVDIDELNDTLDKIILDLSTNYKEKIKVLFLPYKVSMWTSFESIWEQAVQDNDCKVDVVPIPYYEINNYQNNTKLCYEGKDFPPNVSIADWKKYNLEREKPDIVFIHNPYDNTNNLTSIHPFYYSENLKKYTKCLVYSPYFTISGYKKGKSDFQYVNKGTINADKVIVQSDFVKKIYLSYGYTSDKLISLGSPKADAIIKKCQSSVEIPEIWREKLSGKKIFLLNTHLSYFPNGTMLEDKYGFNFAEKYHDEILQEILGRGDCGLIWRPHPLLFTMLDSRFQMCNTYVNNFMKKIEESGNCVIDLSGDYTTAFSLSDAMITTYSSLINEYIITGKPVMIFQSKPANEIAEQSPIDLRTCYFRFKKDGGISFKNFIDMVMSKKDPKYEERMNMLHSRSFANLDGTAGEKIYLYLKEFITK